VAGVEGDRFVAAACGIGFGGEGCRLAGDVGVGDGRDSWILLWVCILLEERANSSALH
jgi:hypothetical protein